MMTPYFYKFDKPLFTDNLILKVKEFVENKLDKFIAYGQHGRHQGHDDGNNYYYAKDLKEIPEIKSFIKNCHLDCYPMIVLHKPKSEVIKHIDDANKRNTVIITPIHPDVGYASTYFWNSKTDTDSVAICDFTKGCPVLFNTQKIHSLINSTNEYRFNLQLCFNEDFEKVLKLYHNNMLFKEENEDYDEVSEQVHIAQATWPFPEKGLDDQGAEVIAFTEPVHPTA